MDFLKDKNITSKDETNYRYVLSQQKNSLYIPVLAVNITYYSVVSCTSALTTLESSLPLSGQVNYVLILSYIPDSKAAASKFYCAVRASTIRSINDQ